MGETVKVIVRCRPMNRREKDLNCNCVIEMSQTNNQISIRNPQDEKADPKTFFFDGVYFVDSTTEQIYSDVGYALVESTCEGFNGTVFAYGQTGCGKSFTMQGIDVPEQRGIIPRAFEHIFETASVESSKFLIHCSYLEIYNEEIRDLLGKDVKQKLDLKEHPQKGVYVAGLSLHKVTSTRQCETVMQRGWENRSTGATLMNADSSRSHSIFSIMIERADMSESGKETIRAGKLNLVDLAGSERQSKTGATGDRLKEATKINLSLSALGNVISALVDGKSTHIPYRDSKLTRLLQDSLGGNTKTLMVACTSPADNNYDESLSTLRYANRAKNIKNKPKVNEDPKDTMIRQYQTQIAQLKAMLLGETPLDASFLSSLGIAGNLQALTGAAQAAGGSNRSPQHKVVQNLEAEKEKIDAERARLQEEYEERLNDAQRKYESERIDKEKLREEIESLRTRYDKKMTQLDRAELRVDQQLTDQEQLSQPSGKQLDPVKEDYSGENDHSVGDKGRGPKSELSDDYVVIDDEANIVPAAAAAAAAATSSSHQDDEMTAGKPIRHPAAAAPSKAVEQQQFDDPNELEALVERLMKNRSSLDNRTAQILEKLQTLNSSVVGGELANSVEAKEQVDKKRRFANARKQKLAEINEMMNTEDEGIMLNIYQNVEDRLKRAMKLLQERKRENNQLSSEISDLQREFQRERSDYLETIRKQERELAYFAAILDKVQPLVRRDCNYSHLDSIKQQSRYDETRNRWVVPDVLLERNHLPTGGLPKPGGSKLATYVDDEAPNHEYYATGGSPRPDNDEEYNQRLNDRVRQNGDFSMDYFKSKRLDKLMNNQMPERLKTSSSSAHARRDTDENRGDYAQSYSSGNLNDDERDSGLSGDLPARKPQAQRLAPLAPLPKSAKKRGSRLQYDD